MKNFSLKMVSVWSGKMATYSRRLVKEKEAGRPLEPVIDKMNKLAREYYENSRPLFCAKNGLVDEIVPISDLRK